MKKLLLLFILIPLISFSQVQIGQNINGEAQFDESGRAIALSLDGSTVAIGAENNAGENPGSAVGHVRVFENISGNWVQVGQDIDGENIGDFIGRSIGLSLDGSIVAIGSKNATTINGSSSGVVRIYQNVAGLWTKIGEDIIGEAENDQFGESISLSMDGNIIAIGAIRNDTNGSESGQVKIFENIGDVWTQIGNSINGDDPGDFLGTSVAISSDGNVVAIGVLDLGNFNDNIGYVEIYENISGVWTQIGSDIIGESIGDRFGSSVSLSFNGNVVAIGATLNDGNGIDSGHARVYENIDDVWIQIGQDINGEAIEDQSGTSLAISSDGSIIAIGTDRNDVNGSSSGHVRIFKNQNSNWIQIGQDIDGNNSDQLGISVAISSDGSIVATGAFTAFTENGVGSGYTSVYDLSAVLSLEDQTTLNFSIYPNPTKNKFTIQLENPSDLQNVNIYNNLGQLILTSKETIIDSSKLTSGLYVVQIETTKGKGSKKLIIE